MAKKEKNHQFLVKNKKNHQNKFKNETKVSNNLYIPDIEKVKELRGHRKDHVSPEELDHIKKNSTKKILYYTPFTDHEDLLFGVGHNPFIEKGCPVTNCFVTNNRLLLSEYYIIKFWSHVDKFS